MRAHREFSELSYKPCEMLKSLISHIEIYEYLLIFYTINKLKNVKRVV